MILGGFVALIGGGELLVRGATSLALAAKVSPLVIGLTVVAFGTSAPELAVSIKSCSAGATELAIGNAVGSNIANVLLVLGCSAIAMPLAVHSRLFRLDIPVMIAAAVALLLLGWDGQLSRLEGGGLVVAMLGYFYWTVATGRREQKLLEAELEELAVPQGAGALILAVVYVALGLVLLVAGADYLVQGCTELAMMFGVSELVIGLTITAVGTSLPELVTSIMASLRGSRDLAVGNIVGSNILNILAVLGISSVVAPAGIPVSPDALVFHIPIMVAVSICCLPVFFTGYSITRGEGAAMLAYYVAYLGYLGYSSSTSPPMMPTWTTTALFVAPVLAIGGIALWNGRHDS